MLNSSSHIREALLVQVSRVIRMGSCQMTAALVMMQTLQVLLAGHGGTLP
jgi:hypothetical protein